ncbi:MAG: hypothetical protein Tsb0014_10370 [Pleurocapsa sp.]
MGIWLRFANIERQVYSIEETATSLRLSGYTEREIKSEVFQGQVVGSDRLKVYQSFNSERDLNHTINGLITEEPQLPPLYYILLHYWSSWLGDSPGVIRSLSAVISLLAFPGLYWLCWELFRQPLVAWTGVGLMAVSPIFVLYAREARLYSLWIVIILFATAALLRALRFNKPLHWVFYTFCLSLGFYTTPLFFLVAIAHAVYLIGTQKAIFSQVIINYLLASLTAVIIFSPWLFFIITNFNSSYNSTSWTERVIPLPLLLASFLINLVYSFLDVPSSIIWKYLTPFYSLPEMVLLIVCLAIIFLIVYSFYFLWSRSSVKTWLLVWSLAIVTSLIFLIPDLFFGGIRSVIPRFQMPLYISILISVAYLISVTTICGTPKIKQKYWRIIAIALISGSVISSVFITQSDIWWNKYFNIDNSKLATIINQPAHPLVISDAGSSNYLNILSLNHLLESKVNFQLLPLNATLTIPDYFQDIFLLNPSSDLKAIIQKKLNYQIDLVYDGGQENPWQSDITLYKLCVNCVDAK